LQYVESWMMVLWGRKIFSIVSKLYEISLGKPKFYILFWVSAFNKSEIWNPKYLDFWNLKSQGYLPYDLIVSEETFGYFLSSPTPHSPKNRRKFSTGNSLVKAKRNPNFHCCLGIWIYTYIPFLLNDKEHKPYIWRREPS
jgi:hypothetical protein